MRDGYALVVDTAHRSAFDRAPYARIIVVDGSPYVLDSRNNIINMAANPRITQAINVVKSTYGATVSVDAKKKNLLKFGRNESVSGSIVTVMGLPSGIDNETYISTNNIGLLVSTSASDTFSCGVEGHTIDGSGNFTFTTQVVSLNGTTPVSLGTPLARCTRLFNAGSVNNVGTISAFQLGETAPSGTPSDGTKVHCIMSAGRNQSDKCATTISYQDWWFITDVSCHVIEKAASTAEFRLEVREKGGVFRPAAFFSASNTSGFEETFETYIIVPANSDVRMRALSSGTNVECTAFINGMLAITV